MARVPGRRRGGRPEGLPFDLDPTRADQAGWGLVVPCGPAGSALGALAMLLDHRRNRVPGDRVKVLDYRDGETAKGWLARHGSYPGTVAPWRVPYYLLIVGGPSGVPWGVQAALALEYAVGRAPFDDPGELDRYARGVVAAETGESPERSREVAYWAPRHAGDPATRMSADHLIGRLWEGCPDEHEAPIARACGFEARAFVGASATGDRLSALLHPERGVAGPAVLVTASHGLEPGDDDGIAGGLVTQVWDGFRRPGASDAFTAREVTPEASVHGLIALIFACFGAGGDDGESRVFASALPRRLLAHPGGGALAILGHVGRAWGYSIRPPGLSVQIGPLRNFLGRVLRGEPVGHAMRDFAERHAATAAAILDRPDDSGLARLRNERADARDFVLLGDPAARLLPALLIAGGGSHPIS